MFFESSNFVFDDGRSPLGFDELVSTLAELGLDAFQTEAKVLDATAEFDCVVLGAGNREDADGVGLADLALADTLDALDVLDVTHVVVFGLVVFGLGESDAPRRGWHLPDEADGHAEGDKECRVENQSDDPQGADLLFVHVWLLVVG